MKRLYAIVAAMAVVASLGVLTPPASQAASLHIVSVQRGPGYKMHSGLQLGAWRVRLSNGKHVLVYTHGGGKPNGRIATIATRPVGITSAGSAQTKLIANLATAKQPSKDVAAAIKVFAEQRSKDKRAFNGHLSGYYRQVGKKHAARIKALVTSLNRDAQHPAGVKATVSAAQLLPGQSGGGSVAVTSGGMAFYGTAAKVTATGAKLASASGLTGTSGLLHFGQAKTSFARSFFKASALVPSDTRVMVNLATGGHAFGLVAGGLGSWASASYAYQKLPATPMLKTSYANKVKGIGQETFTYPYPGNGASGTRWKFEVGGKTATTCSAAAGQVCTASAKLADTSKVTAYVCVRQSSTACKGVWYVRGSRTVIAPAYVQCSINRPKYQAPVLVCKVAKTSKRFYTVRIGYGKHHLKVLLPVGKTKRITLTGYRKTVVLTARWSVYAHKNRTVRLLPSPVTIINRRLH